MLENDTDPDNRYFDEIFVTESASISCRHHEAITPNIIPQYT